MAAQVKVGWILAEKGYDADAFMEGLRVRKIAAVIPPKANRKSKRKCAFALYRERNLVERFFNIIKNFTGIAKRYEKSARNFLADVNFVYAHAWFK